LLPLCVQSFGFIGGLGHHAHVREDSIWKHRAYNVGINWINGNTNASLSDCAVSAIHNRDSSLGPPATFTTVYIDVVCPNNDDAGGISVGAQIGRTIAARPDSTGQVTRNWR
jgi:hypothetical protein